MGCLAVRSSFRPVWLPTCVVGWWARPAGQHLCRWFSYASFGRRGGRAAGLRRAGVKSGAADMPGLHAVVALCLEQAPVRGVGQRMRAGAVGEGECRGCAAHRRLWAGAGAPEAEGGLQAE